MDKEELVTIDLSDDTGCVIETLDLNTVITNDLDELKDEYTTMLDTTQSFQNEVNTEFEQLKKRASELEEKNKDLEARVRRYHDVYDEIRNSVDVFREWSKTVEVSVPYEMGTYLRACGYSKIVKLYDLLVQSPVVLPEV